MRDFFQLTVDIHHCCFTLITTSAAATSFHFVPSLRITTHSLLPHLHFKSFIFLKIYIYQFKYLLPPLEKLRRRQSEADDSPLPFAAEDFPQKKRGECLIQRHDIIFDSLFSIQEPSLSHTLSLFLYANLCHNEKKKQHAAYKKQGSRRKPVGGNQALRHAPFAPSTSSTFLSRFPLACFFFLLLPPLLHRIETE